MIEAIRKRWAGQLAPMVERIFFLVENSGERKSL
jgi:hypothetical protein